MVSSSNSTIHVPFSEISQLRKLKWVLYTCHMLTSYLHCLTLICFTESLKPSKSYSEVILDWGNLLLRKGCLSGRISVIIIVAMKRTSRHLVHGKHLCSSLSLTLSSTWVHSIFLDISKTINCSLALQPLFCFGCYRYLCYCAYLCVFVMVHMCMGV